MAASRWSKVWLKLQQSSLLMTLARGTGAALTVQLLSAATIYGTQILLARWVGIREYGVYDFAISLSLSLAFVGGLGLPSAALRFIPEYLDKQDWGHLHGLLRGGWQQTAIASILTAGLSTIIVQVLRVTFNLEISISVFWGIWLMPLIALMQFQQHTIRAFRQILLAYAPPLVGYPLLLTVIAFCWQGQRVLTGTILVGLSMLSVLLIIIVQVWFFRRSLSAEVRHTTPRYAHRTWWRVALPLLLFDGSYVVLSQTDTLMLGSMLDSKAVGLYSAALKTASWVPFILGAVNAIAAPMFASLHAQGDHQGLQRLVSTIARWMFYPALAIAVGLMLAAEPILRLFGPEFVAAKGSLIVLVVGQLVNVGSGSVGYLLMMTGYQVESALVMGVSALANVILNLIGIHYLGVLGAALATAFSMALWNIWLHAIVVRRLDVHPSILASFRF
jgi:O-antigen/teichoic acid export membrane protein